MDQADWALIKPEKEITPEIEVREDGATIRNGKIRAEINLIGKIAFYNQKGELLLDEYVRNRKDMFGNTCSSLEVEAREFKPITGGDYRLTMRFVSTPEEKIYGMGQYQRPYLDVKELILNWHTEIHRQVFRSCFLVLDMDSCGIIRL